MQDNSKTKFTAIKPTIVIKRVYENPTKKDGERILVDRVWPRGLSKSEARIDEWAKEIAPTTPLRKWYNHQPERWKEFVRLYKKELNKNEEVEKFIGKHKNSKLLTLVFATREPSMSHAQVLQKYLEDHFST